MLAYKYSSNSDAKRGERMSVDLKTQIFQQIEILDFSCIKILMIDDNRKDIELVNELLEVEGDFKFSFHGCTNYKDAQNLIDSQIFKPDLIILDCVMPSVNGKMALEMLKNSCNAKSIPIIVHSSLCSHENVVRCRELKAHAFFEKPLNVEIFKDFLYDC